MYMYIKYIYILCYYVYLYIYINGGASVRVANLSRKIVSVYSAGAEYGT